jgi:hypothetical protein
MPKRLAPAYDRARSPAVVSTAKATARSPGLAIALPCALGIAVIAFASGTRSNPALVRTFVGAGIGLLVWSAVLFVSAGRSKRTLTLAFAPRKQHWLQACAQACVILYWGWHVPLVYTFLPFVAVQLLFAYAIDSLLSWSRRDHYVLSFGPFPVVFSINLFLWFRLDWFHWQLAMIVVGFLAKELIRWNRDGRPAHIFNPSSFPLAVASLALLSLGASGVTYGSFIANTQSDPPNIYLLIFLVSLPGQILFGVARMTLAAVVTMYAISLAYNAVTGTYLFVDAHIPLPVFLGMHLLFTDPSTAPRSELGRIFFGVQYAVLTTLCYVLLTATGAPTFYDKLLPVPIMNLMVRRIDSWMAAPWLSALDPGRLGRSLTPRRRNVIITGVWATAFLGMSAVQGVGDRHPGQYLPFWRTACESGSRRACAYTATLTNIYCLNGSGWACNEAGLARRAVGEPADAEFQRACQLGFSSGCHNAGRPAATVASLLRGPPTVEDLPIVLRGTKPRLREREPARLLMIGCAQGWGELCGAWARAVEAPGSSAL